MIQSRARLLVRFHNAYTVELKDAEESDMMPWRRYDKQVDGIGEYVRYKHKKVYKGQWEMVEG